MFPIIRDYSHNALRCTLIHCALSDSFYEVGNECNVYIPVCKSVGDYSSNDDSTMWGRASTGQSPPKAETYFVNNA